MFPAKTEEIRGKLNFLFRVPTVTIHNRYLLKNYVNNICVNILEKVHIVAFVFDVHSFSASINFHKILSHITYTRRPTQIINTV